MDLEDIMLSEINQRKTTIQPYLYVESKASKPTNRKNSQRMARGGEKR